MLRKFLVYFHFIGFNKEFSRLVVVSLVKHLIIQYLSYENNYMKYTFPSLNDFLYFIVWLISALKNFSIIKSTAFCYL